MIPSRFSTFARNLFLFAALISPGAAQNKPFDPFSSPDGQILAAVPVIPTTSVEFLADVEWIAPGQPFTVAIKLTHPEHWHSYYVNPGTVGMILSPKWEIPEGFEIERIAWPTPHISVTAGQNTYGYEGTVYHLFTVTPPANLESGSKVTLSTTPSWQICDEKSCVPEPPFRKSVTYTLELPVAAEAIENASNGEAFRAGRDMLPKPLPDDVTVSASRDASAVTVLITPASAVPDDQIYFYDSDKQLDAQAKPVVERSEEGVRWSLLRTKGDDDPKSERLAGVLTFGDQGYAVDVEFGRAPAAPVAFGKLLTILGGMFVGGMILNLMPCVFPVIGLKIMSFVQQAGEERKKIALHGVIFAAGVVLSFWVLAGFLLGLREGVLGSAGENSSEIGWGYQLQNPWMVWGLMLVMFILALNMFGVFEIGASATGVGGSLARKQGVSGTFFSGVLATIVATPCSAPFLGAALGATFALPSALFMLSFTAMALGLAFPYLLLSIFPQLNEKLPRPGPWMESFKQAMSFLLFATAGFLLWVYVTQIELGSMLNVVIGLTAIATAAWIYGRWCVISKAKRTRVIGFIFAIAFAAAGYAMTRPPAESNLVWEEWSVEAVEEALDEDRPVFVDFTAAWCATCQVNKKTAYSDDVAALIEKSDVLLLKADNTSRKPAINAAIRELGRAAVPVNVLYVPDDDQPHLTTELFTAGYLVDFLNEHLGEKSSGE